jgi:hypothetical protein
MYGSAPNATPSFLNGKDYRVTGRKANKQERIPLRSRELWVWGLEFGLPVAQEKEQVAF